MSDATGMVRLLAGVAVAGGLLAVAGWVWPTSGAPAPTAPAIADAFDPPRTDSLAVRAADAATRIVATDLFSPTRRPPDERFEPAVADTFAAPSYEDDAAYADTAPAADPAAAPVPHLYGVVGGPSGRRVLARLRAESPAAALYREGDEAGGFRVVAIGPDHVTLDGPEGRVVLNLPSRPRDR